MTNQKSKIKPSPRKKAAPKTVSPKKAPAKASSKPRPRKATAAVPNIPDAPGYLVRTAHDIQKRLPAPLAKYSKRILDAAARGANTVTSAAVEYNEKYVKNRVDSSMKFAVGLPVANKVQAAMAKSKSVAMALPASRPVQNFADRIKTFAPKHEDTA